MTSRNENLPMRMRYTCNTCGYSHDSYWKDFDHCMDEKCGSKNVTKIDLESLVEEELFECETEVKTKRGRKKK